ncbi:MULTISPECIES: hypothetical protein [unclassified Methylophaga]|jgi:hypothetical protein|uniref:hypothetical protein n=2 Tax=Methylophaga TaxID=40222 RepID=UPI000C94FA0E|nr:MULTISPECIES: hypothetical protein [unclassified Methylophaga]MAK66478.1 hypothetical protein [Methylophaga sp.]MAY17171.1 hypothetical protein [Methylophaga sp.]MBN46035.1 hypothetical protein [Methylophaga sp.]HAO24125.1 hypothetical protein [Methylophaga sp.]HCD05722.1 hypothetical protein [Methylophaga sp.]|tara:strand:+ start:1570 stop:2262 length:693 start_codon:yes stop_codon:yes gene_type:complete
MRWHKLLLICGVFFVLPGCATDSTAGSPNISSFAKSNIDDVIELHQQRLMQDLKTLTIKLYQRNPNQRHDRHLRTLEDSVARLFIYPANVGFDKWDGFEPTEIIRLALTEDYDGDRVLAFTVGMRRMLMASYNNQSEFYYLSSVDQQKLYNSARNIEIAAWMLAEKRDENGKRLLLSDSLQEESRNLSFQRIIGGMIATQDNLAAIIAQKNGRLVKTVVVQAASMMFLPI